MTPRPRRLLLALALLPLGCIRTFDDTASPPGALLSDCALATPSGVAGWGTPAAVPYDGGPLWVFDALALTGGGTLPGAAVRVRDPEAACAGGSELLTDGGAPLPVLSLTAAEASANAARTDGRRLSLVPRAGFVAGGRGHLFYDHVFSGPEGADPARLGTGLCVQDGPEAPCLRAVDGAGSTVLWAGDELAVRSAHLDGEQLVVLVCRAPAALEQRCTWWRAPAAAAADPTAYRWWNSLEGVWTTHRGQATAVLSDLADPSAAPSPFQGGILAVLVDPFEARVSARFAAAPSSPFGASRPLFDGARPEAGALAAGVGEQPSLRGEDGRIIRVAYATARGGGLELHLATFRFDEVIR